MTSSPDNTVENILDDLCKNTQVDYGYEKLVPSETIKAKQSLDSHYLSIFLEVIPKKSHKAQRAYRVDSNDYTAVVKEKARNKALDELRTALQDRLGEKS